MPTIFSHPAVPLALRYGFGERAVSGRLLVAGITCSMLPDLDVLAFDLGIPYDSPFGHRGFTHSIFFALMLALLCAAGYRRLRVSPGAAFMVCFVSAASHGLLDAFTNGGLGVAFLWPFSDQRFFFSPSVIQVSPLGWSFFLHDYSWRVLESELVWVWLPCALTAVLVYAVRHVYARR